MSPKLNGSGQRAVGTLSANGLKMVEDGLNWLNCCVGMVGSARLLAGQLPELWGIWRFVTGGFDGRSGWSRESRRAEFIGLFIFFGGCECAALYIYRNVRSRNFPSGGDFVGKSFVIGFFEPKR